MAGFKKTIKRVSEKLGLLYPAFRLVEALNTRKSPEGNPFPDNIGPDGLPVPPASLIVLVGGRNTPRAFLAGGEVIAGHIREMMARAGRNFDDLEAVLDFGCGAGRVLRFLRAPDGAAGPRLFGTDYNPKLVSWCRANLPFAEFGVNELQPPLRYADAQFDLVYSFSVFTHLVESSQHAWMAELARVVRPGGFALITVHGEHYLGDLTPVERERFQAGEFVARHDTVEGTNLCSVYHPRAFVDRLIAGRFEVAAWAPALAVQDFVLLRRLPG